MRISEAGFDSSIWYVFVTFTGSALLIAFLYRDRISKQIKGNKFFINNFKKIVVYSGILLSLFFILSYVFDHNIFWILKEPSAKIMMLLLLVGMTGLAAIFMISHFKAVYIVRNRSLELALVYSFIFSVIVVYKLIFMTVEVNFWEERVVKNYIMLEDISKSMKDSLNAKNIGNARRDLNNELAKRNFNFEFSIEEQRPDGLEGGTFDYTDTNYYFLPVNLEFLEKGASWDKVVYKVEKKKFNFLWDQYIYRVLFYLFLNILVFACIVVVRYRFR